jgi:hypothetical protein
VLRRVSIEEASVLALSLRPCTSTLGPITKRDQIFVTCSSGTKTHTVVGFHLQLAKSGTWHLRIARYRGVERVVSRLSCTSWTNREK